MRTPTNTSKNKLAGFGPFYAVFQAEAMKFKGIKLYHKLSWGAAIAVFPTKEDARNYLAELLKTIHHEQTIGWRTPNNLNPKESLDFLIAPVTIGVEIKTLGQRGWDLSKPETDLSTLEAKRKITHTGKKGRETKNAKKCKLTQETNS